MRIRGRLTAPVILLALGCTTGEARPDAGPSVGSFAPAADGDFTLARAEICNNGIDDDQNDVIDDGCVCFIDAVQECYPGWPAYAGVGACTFGRSTCVADGSVGAWGACEGAVAPASVEACGDGIDGDCDGMIDEGCPCDEEGVTQSCFGGSADQLNVGICVAGLQRCERKPSLDDTWVLGWGECEGAVDPSPEQCNGLDDDCDGIADNIVEICNVQDDDCDGEVDEGESCGALPPNWRLSLFWPPTGSGVLDGRAALYAVVETAPQPCDGVLIEDLDGEIRCVEAPPSDCPEGTQPQWTDEGWTCTPCAVLVQFGYLFGFERTCAPEPALECTGSSVPTYRAESREWECLPECDNTEYDRAFRDGRLVCVPC